MLGRKNDLSRTGDGRQDGKNRLVPVIAVLLPTRLLSTDGVYKLIKFRDFWSVAGYMSERIC